MLLINMSRLVIGIIALCAFITSNKNEAARILAVFPTPSISHQVVFRPLTQALVKRGHEVIVITTDPVFPKGQTPENLTEIDTNDISYKPFKEEMAKINADVINGDMDMNEQNDAFLLATMKIFEAQTKIPEVQDILKNKNNTFDLLIVEAWTRYALGFSHAIKVPVIAISSFGAMFDNYDVIGAPSHPFLYPMPISKQLYNLTPWEKISEFYEFFNIMRIYKRNEAVENIYVRKIFGEDAPALSELQNNVQMLFLNVHPIWDNNRPVPPGVVYMGGLHQNPQKELPKDLKNYLDSSVNGVIYISFGTNVEPTLLPPEIIQTIVQAVSNLTYDVLWKWNHGELPGRTKNIRTSKWFPQSDLLRHPKLKLFITQGGLQSTDEALTAGVPLIGIPILGDQWYNVKKYEHHKIGMYFEPAKLNAESLKSAIETVIEDRSYRNNVVRLKTIMDDQPMSPLERAVWWTEHVLRHGGARHLRSPAANMPWTVYYEIDLVLAILAVVLVAIILITLVVYKVVKLILRQFSGSVKVKSN